MSTTPAGVAAPGWPISGSVLDGQRLHMVSRNLDRTRVAVIDVSSWTLRAERTIAVGDGAWGLTVAPDGVYIGLFGARGSGNLHRLAGSSLTVVAQLAVDYIWDLATLPDGRILGVCTLPSLVFLYDPASRRAADIGMITGQAQHPRTCAVTPSRIVVGGTGSGRAVLIDRALGGGATRSILPAALADDVTIYCSTVTPAGRVVVGTSGPNLDRPAIAVFDPNNPAAATVARLPREALVDTVLVVGNSIYATARPSGGLYRLDLADNTVHRLAAPVAMSETRSLHLVGQQILGTSADGSAWTAHRTSAATRVRDPEALGLQRRPQRTQSIVAAEEVVDVGGSFSLTRHDLAAGSASTQFLPGEAKAMVRVGSTTYLAVYPIGEIWAWEAGQPAPRRVTQLASDQLRPIAMAWSTRLQALVVTTTDDRQRHVLNTVDPVTGRVDALINPLGAQAVAGVTVEGGTIYIGGSGNQPAVGVVDMPSGRLLWSVPNVIPDGGFVLGVAVVGNRLAVTTSNGWFTTVDLTSRAVATPVRVAQSAGWLRQSKGQLLLATGDALLRLDPATRTATTVASGLGGAFWGWPPLSVDPLGRAWVVKGRDLVRTDPVRP